MSTPAERLSQAYGSGPANLDPEERRRRRIASGYQPNAQSERLLELQRTDPAAFAKLPTSLKASLGYYKNAKHAAEGSTNAGGGIEQQIADAQAAYTAATTAEERTLHAHRLVALRQRQQEESRR